MGARRPGRWRRLTTPSPRRTAAFAGCTGGGWPTGCGVPWWRGTSAPGETMTMMPVHTPVRPPLQRRAGQANDLLPLGDWIRHHSLRSWAVLLFLLLICVPSIALYILGPNPSASTIDEIGRAHV